MSEKLHFVDFGAPDKFGAHLFRIEIPAVRTDDEHLVVAQQVRDRLQRLP